MVLRVLRVGAAPTPTEHRISWCVGHEPVDATLRDPCDCGECSVATMHTLECNRLHPHREGDCTKYTEHARVQSYLSDGTGHHPDPCMFTLQACRTADTRRCTGFMLQSMCKRTRTRQRAIGYR